MRSCSLLPAYGRDYKNGKAAAEAFLTGKDFVLCDLASPYDGRLCSIRDLGGYDSVQVRYKNAQNLVVLTQKNGAFVLAK